VRLVHHALLASLSDPAIGLAALAVLVSSLTGLITIFLTLVKNDRRKHTLALATVSAIVICGFTAVVDPLLSVYIAMGLLVILGLWTAFAIGAERSISLARLPSRLRNSSRPKTAVLAVSVLLPVVAALIVGLLIGGSGGDSHPTVVAQSGSYHVANTCFDGVCTVNVCRNPERCREGKENVGELDEGTAIEIQCQTSGGMVHGAHDRSLIWDRLSNGFYISDLFVEETRTGHFTHEIPRCENA
jgi:hypothetical protein